MVKFEVVHGSWMIVHSLPRSFITELLQRTTYTNYDP